MFCSKCGNATKASDKFCERCGAPIASEISAPPFNTTEAQPLPHKNGKAKGSLAAGIVGLIFFPAAIAAIVLGNMSRSQMKKIGGHLEGSGMALAGLILGYAGIAIPLLLILAAIAIPSLLRARIAANEASAIGTIRAITAAEGRYKNTFPGVGYTCNLSSLGGSDDAPATREHARMIDDAITVGTRFGYRFDIQNCRASGGAVQTYQVIAIPERFNQTGVRAFCSDESGVIRSDATGSIEQCLSSGSGIE